MTNRLLLVLCIASLNCYGQLTVFRDEKGQVFTFEDVYGRGIGATHQRLTYLGSPFLTFPVWRPGVIRVDEAGKDLACELAYNLVSNVILCRFPGDSAVKIVAPEWFTIGENTYVRQQNKVLGVDYRIYTRTLHDGKTKLLLSQSKRADPYASVRREYTKDRFISGTYVPLETYYIRKGDAKPEPIGLTKNSVLGVLYEQADKLADRLPSRRLTVADVIHILPYYDSLMTVDWATKQTLAAADAAAENGQRTYVLNKAPLSNDPAFNQTLHQRITYPTIAWTQGVYGRIYAGFDVTTQGKIKNVTILSPDNVGMGFIESVRNGLENVGVVDPAFAGSYVLPVSFTYANRTEKTSAHVPLNRLTDDRLAGRTLLEEFIVPMVVTKPVSSAREVWGYYK